MKNLINAETIQDGCGVNTVEYWEFETCYVCSSFVRGGGNICYECIRYVLIGLIWNCALCRTFSDTKCFDRARVLVRANRNHNLRDVGRVNYCELSDNDDDSDGVVADVDESDTMDEGNEDNVNRDDMINSSDEDNGSEDGSEHGHVDFDEYQDDGEGMFDIRSYRSESDHDSDIGCRICFADVDLAYHDVVEERRNDNWSAPYCEECNSNRLDPRMVHCCGFWQSEECCVCSTNGEN